MSLPKIDHPTHLIEIPSTKKKAKFRPFLVKEEKLLLMAKEGENDSEILQAVKQVVTNCCLDNLNVDRFTIFDLEFVFLRLRALSVDNMVKLTYQDLEDKQPYEFQIDLNTVKVIFPENISENIPISDNAGIVLKYPMADLYNDKEFLSLEKEHMFELVLRCLDKVAVDDQVYEFKDYKKAEVEEFLDQLSPKVFEDIQTFLLNVPRLEHVIEYTNSLGSPRKIVLSSLNDFFMWR